MLFKMQFRTVLRTHAILAGHSPFEHDDLHMAPYIILSPWLVLDILDSCGMISHESEAWTKQERLQLCLKPISNLQIAGEI